MWVFPLRDKQMHVPRAELGAGNTHFCMNVKRAPFLNPRVGKAIRVVADRQARVDNALLGYGTPRSDQISQDVAQAKSLSKAAGQPNLTTTSTTSSETSARSQRRRCLPSRQRRRASH